MNNSSPTKPSFKVVKPNTLIAAMTAVLLITIGLYFFIKYAIFTEIARIFFVTIASKTSETTLILDVKEFQTLSYIVIAVAAVLLFVVLFLIKLHKNLGAALITLASATLAGFYAAVMLGNSFHELWGGAWSALGILLAVVITLAIDALVLTSLRVEKPQAK